MSKDAYGNPNTPITATAIDVDYGGAVRNRVVGVYPTTTARDAALTSPDEGAVAVITGDEAVTIYDGSAWSTVLNYGMDPAGSDYSNSSGQLTATAYADLAPVTSYDFISDVEVSIVTGARAAVWISAALSNATGGATTYLAYAISGASSSGAASARSLQYESSNANDRSRGSVMGLHEGLTPGTNVFTLQGKVSSGVGTISTPYILVIPLP